VISLLLNLPVCEKCATNHLIPRLRLGTGTSILVAGVSPLIRSDFSSDSESVLVMSYDLDGHIVDKHYFAADAPEKHLMHMTYFVNDSLLPGEHTLKGTISRASESVSAKIDYITYKPSFALLPGKPDFQSDFNQTHSKTPISAIVGGLVGGVVIVTAVAVCFWHFHKKNGGISKPDHCKFT